MHLIAKWILILLATLAVILVALYSFLEVYSSQSKSELDDLVTRYSKVRYFSEVKEELGKPVQVLTEYEHIKSWLYEQADQSSNHSLSNSNLYLYMHKGPPFRWLFLIVDKDTNEVLNCGWTHM